MNLLLFFELPIMKNKRWLIYIGFLPIILSIISYYLPLYKNVFTILIMTIVGVVFYFNYKFGKIKHWQFFLIVVFLTIITLFNLFYNNQSIAI
jgi:hypothetical protein